MKKERILNDVMFFIERFNGLKAFDDYKYNSEIDAKIFQKSKTIDEFLENLYNDYSFEIQEEIDLIISSLENSIIQELDEKYNTSFFSDNYFKIEDELNISDELLDSNEDIGILKEIYDIINNVEIDYSSNILDETNLLVNIMPNQRENLNTEGYEFYDLINAIIDKDKKTLSKLSEESNLITDLFKSQGYSLLDMCMEDKIESSIFLNTFYNELLNAYTESSLFLVFLQKMKAREYIEFKEGKSFLNFKDGSVGLFDPVHGGGSILSIELEKPFEIQPEMNNDFDYLQIEKCRGYGYSINEIYDLPSEYWENSSEFIKK